MQSFSGFSAAPGEARPGWKILRVLGNLVDAAGYDFVDSTEVRDEVLAQCRSLEPDNRVGGLGEVSPQAPSDWERIGGVPMYAVDGLTRRAHALQLTPDAWAGELRMHPEAAASLGLADDATVRVSQGEASAEFAVVLDEAVPQGCIWLPTAVPGTETLGAGFGPVSIEQV